MPNFPRCLRPVFSPLLALAILATSVETVVAQVNATPLFRLRNIPTGRHLFTISSTERGTLLTGGGWADEGIAGWVTDAPIQGAAPLLRLSRALQGAGTVDHFYTTSQAEAENAVTQYGYVREGNEGYVFTSELTGALPLYRFNLGIHGHFYTTNVAERDDLLRQGFKAEGITGWVFDSQAALTRVTLTVGPLHPVRQDEITTPVAPPTPPPGAREIAKLVTLRITGFQPAPVREDEKALVFVIYENASEVLTSGSLTTGVDGVWSNGAAKLDIGHGSGSVGLSLPPMKAGLRHISLRYQANPCAAGADCLPEAMTTAETTADVEVHNPPLDRLFPLVATLYRDSGLVGTHRVVLGDVEDLRFQGFNDQASSILIQPGPDYAEWKTAHPGTEPVLQLFRDAFFTGGSRALPIGRYPDIGGSYGIRDLISSLRYAPDGVVPAAPAQPGVPVRDTLPVIITVFADALPTCAAAENTYSDSEIAAAAILSFGIGAELTRAKGSCTRYHPHLWLIEDTQWLGNASYFNDAISAIRVDRGPTYRGESVFFFTDQGCRGTHITVPVGEARQTLPKDIRNWMLGISGGPYPPNVRGDLANENFNDMISSIHIGTTPQCSADAGGLTPPAPAPPPPPSAPSRAVLRSVASGKQLGVSGSGADLEPVRQFGAGRSWSFEPLTGADQGWYLIHLDGTAACLDVQGSAQEDGAGVIVYQCSGTDNQKWRMIPVATCIVLLEAKHSQKLLDLPSSSTEDGVQLTQYARHGGPNQQWRICEGQ